MSTVVMLLVCLSSVVRADGLVDESSVAAMAKAMRDEMREELREEMREEMREQTSKQQQIVKLKDALEKKEEDARKAKTEPTYVQLTTGGEVVELVSATGFKGLAERFDAAEEKSVAQDAEIGTIGTTVSKMREELKTGRAPSDERGDQLARELDAAKATLAAQQAQISELSATVAQLLATPQTRLTPVDATKTTASRRLEEAGSPPPSLATEAICAPEAWVGYDGETCGECAALVKVRDNGGTCAGFCSLQGLDCVEGWDDETDNECSLGAAVKACDHSFGVGTSDAVCKCGQPPDDPPQPPTSPPPPSPPLPPAPPPPPSAWPPLPVTANELRISGRHTAIAFNTNVGVEPFRCVGVSDGKLTCTGELLAADFRTASGISLEELALFAGMVPPAVPPPPMPPTPPPAVYVSPGISTIQDAHDLASPGSELILADGIYLSSTSGTEVLRISKSIKVRALNPGQAVLHAQASAGNPACRRGSTCRRVIHILGGVVSLEGLNITGGMRDGHPYGGAGLAIVGGATVTVNKCNIYDNHVHNSGGLEINDRGGGVLITGRSTVSIVHSHIFGNTAENHGGVYVISGNAVLDSCLVYDSNVHAGCAYWNKRNLCTGREDGDEASVCYKSLALTNVQECA